MKKLLAFLPLILISLTIVSASNFVIQNNYPNINNQPDVYYTQSSSTCKFCATQKTFTHDDTPDVYYKQLPRQQTCKNCNIKPQYIPVTPRQPYTYYTIPRPIPRRNCITYFY